LLPQGLAEEPVPDLDDLLVGLQDPREELVESSAEDSTARMAGGRRPPPEFPIGELRVQNRGDLFRSRVCLSFPP
jgi:hypothetical protein